MTTETPALEARSLVCGYRAGRLPWRRTFVPVVRDVNLEIARGETLALVGESGCGKSTLARALLRLVEPAHGEVRVNGAALTGLPRRTLQRHRRRIQMVFQDPDRSLSPRRTVEQSLREALSLAPEGNVTPSELLARVELDAALLHRFPVELSGGQRQRVAIARALAPGPDVLIADEPVSALDVSVQARIINLLATLQRQLGLAMLFISHDLAVVRRVSHRVAVMYLGEIVEAGPTEGVLGNPAHPYTRALLDAVPRPDPGRSTRRVLLPGDVPAPGTIPPGCPFHPRCPEAMARCREVFPRVTGLASAGSPHTVRCLLHE